jgi:type I restriction enzyme S subunit
MGDIIFSRNASIGSAAYVDTEERFCMGQDVCLITSASQNQLFLTYQLNSQFISDQIRRTMVGATFTRINVGDIGLLRVCCPPVGEQAEIAECLTEYDRGYGRIASRIHSAITLLREYRAALISAAVTGQLDIRKHEKQLEALA